MGSTPNEGDCCYIPAADHCELCDSNSGAKVYVDYASDHGSNPATCFVKVDEFSFQALDGVTVEWHVATEAPLTEAPKVYGLPGSSGPIAELRYAVDHMINAAKDFAIAAFVLPMQIMGFVPPWLGSTLMEVFDNSYNQEDGTTDGLVGMDFGQVRFHGSIAMKDGQICPQSGCQDL